MAGDEFCKAAVLFYKNGDVAEAKEMMLKASGAKFNRLFDLNIARVF